MSQKTTTKPLLSFEDLYPEQKKALRDLEYRPRSLFIAKKGFGKAVIGHTIATCWPGRTLVIAPPRVVESTWAHEWEKWDWLGEPHVVSSGRNGRDWREDPELLGFGAEKVVVMSMKRAHEYLQDREAVPFDNLIIDELTHYQSPSSKGVKVLRRRGNQFERVLGMTATPFAESGFNVYGMALAVDGGATLGRNQERFRLRYGYPLDRNGYRWEFLPRGRDRLAEDLSSLVVLAEDAGYEDDLPKLRVVPYEVGTMDGEVADLSDRLGRSYYVSDDLTVDSAATLMGKLQQLSVGFHYTQPVSEQAAWVEVCRLRSEVSAGVIREWSSKSNVLVAYWYKAQLEMFREAFGAEVPELRGDRHVQNWNAGRYPVASIHPASGGHGLNLQAGGSTLVFLSPIWSADLRDQLIGRLWRRGQEADEVCVYEFFRRGSVEEEMLKRVKGKNEAAVLQEYLLRVAKEKAGVSPPEHLR